jgi:hypothetical protein
MQVADRDDPLANVPELQGFGPELAESLLQLSDPLASALVTPVDSGFPAEQHRQHGAPLDLGVEFPQQRFDVSAVVSISPALEGLDVLLRHCPRTISLLGEVISMEPAG